MIRSQIKKISIIIPTFNELRNIEQLIIRISDSLHQIGLDFELIFIDDNSTDGTREYLTRFQNSANIVVQSKRGKKGKAYSLFEGFALATGDVVGMIDADLQYPPENITKMVEGLKNSDIVIANRKHFKAPRFRRFLSRAFKVCFGKVLFGITHDIQSGLKLFRKEVVDTVSFLPRSSWAFDLEFLIRAKEAGYTIRDHDITFEPRSDGKSKVHIFKTAWELGIDALLMKSKKIHPMTIKPKNGSMLHAGVGFKQNRYITHTTLPHNVSALRTITAKHKIFVLILLAVIAGGVVLDPLLTAIIAVGILSSIYFIDVLFNMFIILKGLYIPSEIKSTDDDLARIDESDLPIYSILCPLYKEAHIIPQFVKAIEAMDYPKKKLDVMLLLEEDDSSTIEQVEKLNLPPYMRTLVVPHSMPKTKPKACNYGLGFAKGEYLVIYDAEDMPDPLQLKKAFLAFKKVPKNVLCLQAKLNYYNPHQNWLTKFFTAEYSLWFDLTLTGFQSLNTAIPLGGTSNHFRTKDLLHLEGWDPFNVTEDADLGVRLFKKGFRTAIIDSTTLEEANSSFINWIRQRSRWLKGYMQTYLVHTRDTGKFVRQHGIHALLFQLIVGGKLAFILINPLLWAATISYFALNAIVGPTIEALYPPVIFYIAVTSLVVGNFLFLYYYMIGCMKRGQYGLVKYVYLVPFYWLMISWAGFVGFYQLLFKPHYWEKTIHGLHLDKNITKNIKKVKKALPSMVVEAEQVEEQSFYPNSLRDRFARLIQSRGVYAGGTFLIAASVIGNFFNLVFNSYFGRVLNPADFGLLALVGSFWYIASVPLSAVGSTVNFRTGFLDTKLGENNSRSFWSFVRSRSFIVAAIIAALWSILSPFMASYFQVQDITPFLLFAPVWLFGFAYFIDHGYLSGKLMFGWLAVVAIVEVILKLAIGYGISLENTRYVYTAIPISFVISVFLGWIIILLTKRKGSDELDKDELRSIPKKFFAVSVLSGLSMVSFLTLDVILAKHYLSPTEAGQYALLSLVGKMIFFAGTLAAQFVIPLVSRDEGANRNSKKTLYIILVSTSLLAGSAYLLFGLFGQHTLTNPFLFGDRINPVVQYLPFFGLAMMWFVIGRIFVTYYLARRVYTFPIVSFLLAGLQFVLIDLYHENIAAIVLAMIIVGGLNLFLMFILHINSDFIMSIERNVKDLFGLFGQEEKVGNSNGKLNILIYNWRDTKHVWSGGAEVYVYEIAKRFVRDGNHVTLFSGNDGKSPRNQVLDGIQIIRRGGTYMVYLWAFLYYALKFRGKYDIIVDCENGIPFFSPIYVRKPVILVIHHIHQEVFRAHLKFPLSAIARLLEAKVMPFIYKNKQIITVSESSKKEIIKMGISKSQLITIVHNGVDAKSFISSEKENIPLFTYLGRLKDYKNVNIAIEAFAKLAPEYPNAKLSILGSGESGGKLIELAKKLGIQNSVTFMGKVSEKKKVQILGRSWVVLQPSMMEGWGISVIEANAAGTPVIASNVPGLRDAVVDGKTGLLVPVSNPSAMYGAMKLMLINPKSRMSFSKNAKEWSEKFDWDKSADKFYAVILSEVEDHYGKKLVQELVFVKSK